MNNAIAFFVGAITFVAMMIIKIPIKLFIKWLAGPDDYDGRDVLIKRCNSVIFLVTMVVAVLVYWGVIQVIYVPHFKLCCSLKAGAIAIAIYAVYEQWFGV